MNHSPPPPSPEPTLNIETFSVMLAIPDDPVSHQIRRQELAESMIEVREEQSCYLRMTSAFEMYLLQVQKHREQQEKERSLQVEHITTKHIKYWQLEKE